MKMLNETEVQQVSGGFPEVEQDLLDWMRDFGGYVVKPPSWIIPV